MFDNYRLFNCKESTHTHSFVSLLVDCQLKVIRFPIRCYHVLSPHKKNEHSNYKPNYLIINSRLNVCVRCFYVNKTMLLTLLVIEIYNSIGSWSIWIIIISGVSLWCNGLSDGLQNRSMRVCYYIHFRANTLGKGMNPLILPAMG